MLEEKAGRSCEYPRSVVEEGDRGPEFSGNGAEVYGLGSPGDKVVVRLSDDVELGTATVRGDRTYHVHLSRELSNGESAVVVFTSPDGAEPRSIPLAAPDRTPPAAPADVQYSPDGKMVTGTAEPKSIVLAVWDGKSVGSQVVTEAGEFSMELASSFTNGEKLKYYAADFAGNLSTPAEFEAPDITPPGVFAWASGGGEALYVMSRDAHSVKVLALGNVAEATRLRLSSKVSLFQLKNPLTNGEDIVVEAADKAGNTSSFSVKAPDFQPPKLEGKLWLGAELKSVHGKTEPGAWVAVYADDGSDGGVLYKRIGAGKAASDGTFVATLCRAVEDGEPISIAIVDAALNRTDMPYTVSTKPAPVPDGDDGTKGDGASIIYRAAEGAVTEALADREIDPMNAAPSGETTSAVKAFAGGEQSLVNSASLVTLAKRSFPPAAEDGSTAGSSQTDDGGIARVVATLSASTFRGEGGHSESGRKASALAKIVEWGQEAGEPGDWVVGMSASVHQRVREEEPDGDRDIGQYQCESDGSSVTLSVSVPVRVGEGPILRMRAAGVNLCRFCLFSGS